MRILLTNDDGIDAIGINVLAEVFSKDNEVMMIAPDTERSACSHSLSIHHDINYELRSGHACKAYAISGTPADCVKLGILALCDNKPDLVISGINNGSNLGSDIMYSGTVSAAFESIYLGTKAIAISLSLWNCEREKYVAAANFLHEHLSSFLSCNLPSKTLLNVNYPANMPFKGARMTKVGLNLYADVFVNGGSSGSFRLQGAPMEHDLNDEDCDVEWCKKGYATVSPIHLDKNDYESLERLKKECKLI